MKSCQPSFRLLKAIYPAAGLLVAFQERTSGCSSTVHDEYEVGGCNVNCSKHGGDGDDSDGGGAGAGIDPPPPDRKRARRVFPPQLFPRLVNPKEGLEIGCLLVPESTSLRGGGCGEAA